MKSAVRILQILAIALPLTSSAALPIATKSAADKHAPKKIPMNGVYVNYLHVKPGQLSFKVTGRFVKTYKELWTSVEDANVQAALLSAFYQHKRIDITDYTVSADKKSNTLLAKEITVYPN